MSGLPTLPKEVHIGFLTYEVRAMSPDYDRAGQTAGHTYHMPAEIVVRTSDHPAQVADSFLHEILHGIYHVTGLSDEDNEERTVTALAHGLIEFIQRNPRAVAWLQDASKRKKAA